MGNKHEKLQTSQFVCTWFGGGGVLIIRKRLQQLRGGGFAVVCQTSPACNLPPIPLSRPPLVASAQCKAASAIGARLFVPC